jgi:hypothetical protein
MSESEDKNLDENLKGRLDSDQGVSPSTSIIGMIKQWNWKSEITLVLSCLILSCFLGSIVASRDLFWGDEVITAHVISMDWWELIKDRFGNAHSPVYFLIVKLWMILFTGGSVQPLRDELLLRLPSIIAMSMAGGFMVSLAWRMAGALPAFGMTVLWLGSPMIAHYTVEARPYAFLVFLLAAALWANSILIMSDSKSRLASDRPWLWRMSSIASVGAVLVMPLGVLVVVVLELTMLRCHRYRYDQVFRATWRKRCLVVYPMLVIMIGIMAIPIEQKINHYWTEKMIPFSMGIILERLREIYLPLTYGPNSSLISYYTNGLGSILVVFLAFRTVWRSPRSEPVLMLCALAFLLPLLLVVLSAKTSLLVSRYFLPAVPAFLLLAAMSMTFRYRSIVLSIIGALVVMTFIGEAFICRIEPRKLDVKPLLAFFNSHSVARVVGGSHIWSVQRELDFYLAHRGGGKISLIQNNFTINHAAGDERLFWFFGKQQERIYGADLIGWPVVRLFRAGEYVVTALALSREDLPLAIRDRTYE